jgi:hypothetical protein
VFLGPSVPIAQARRLLEAQYLPPIARGDLPKAVADGARRILIIDGVFGERRAVSLSEIRAALALDVELWGAASIGALRAAEATSIGMRGVGKIFELFQKNEIADDEVALVFADGIWLPLSEPLICIRAALSFAEQNGWITAAEHSIGLRQAEMLHFPERTLHIALCALADEKQRSKVKLQLESARDAWDIKRRDALAALRLFSQFGQQSVST